MNVVALYNIKGGVGKTAAAVNLAYLAARDGLETLIWDLDPQGASSFYFRIKPKLKGGAGKLVKGKRELQQSIRGTDFPGLDLLPADFSNRNLDLHLDATRKPTARLARLLEPLEAEYDLLLLDCPPSISLASEAVFVAADALLVPTIPTYLSLRTLDQLRRYLDRRGGKRRPQVWPFFSMVDWRKSLHRSICSATQQAHSEFLQTSIPYASAIEKMGERRAPLLSYAPADAAAKAYGALWRELVARLRAP